MSKINAIQAAALQSSVAKTEPAKPVAAKPATTKPTAAKTAPTIKAAPVKPATTKPVAKTAEKKQLNLPSQSKKKSLNLKWSATALPFQKRNMHSCMC